MPHTTLAPCAAYLAHTPVELEARRAFRGFEEAHEGLGQGPCDRPMQAAVPSQGAHCGLVLWQFWGFRGRAPLQHKNMAFQGIPVRRLVFGGQFRA